MGAFYSAWSWGRLGLAQKQRRFVARMLPVPVRRFFLSVGWRVLEKAFVFVAWSWGRLRLAQKQRRFVARMLLVPVAVSS